MVDKTRSLNTLLFLLAFSINPAFAQEPQVTGESVVLQVQPNKCIALRKGKRCYQKLNISFKASNSADYCLHANERGAPLTCWKNAFDGKLSYVFNSNESVRFVLFQNSGESVAETVFTVAWVYGSSSRKRNGWRLF